MKYQYLLREYECCYEQLRYYDTRNFNLLKFVFTMTTAVATAQFAIYKITNSATQTFFFCQTFLSMIVFVASLLIFVSMLQNRLYFVYIGRQINAIRSFMLETDAPEFQNNQLYTSTDFPALKLSSVHTFQIIGTAFVSSLFASSSAYSFGPAMGKDPNLAWAVVVFLVIVLTEVIGGIAYLKSAEGKTADEFIHGTSSNPQESPPLTSKRS